MDIKQIDTSSDIEKLRSLAMQAFSDTPDASLDEWVSFDEMVKTIHAGRGICLKSVADDGGITGVLYAQEENPVNGNEGTEKWVIVILAVDLASRHKGIGSKLLFELEAILREKGIKKLFVYTNMGDEKVVEFYKKNNYEGAGYVRDYLHGEGNSAVFLLKYLTA